MSVSTKACFYIVLIYARCWAETLILSSLKINGLKR